MSLIKYCPLPARTSLPIYARTAIGRWRSTSTIKAPTRRPNYASRSALMRSSPRGTDLVLAGM